MSISRYKIKKNAYFLIFCIACAVTLCEIKLFYFLFSYKGKNLNKQFINISNRLDIVDSNGIILASNVVLYDLYLMPSKMINVQENVDKLIAILPSLSAYKMAIMSKIYAKLDNKNDILFIKNRVSFDEKMKILQSGVLGVEFREKHFRIYKNPELMTHVIGALSYENRPLFGLELGLDSYLRNTDNQKSLMTSVNLRVQAIMYDLLNETKNKYMAKGAFGVVMNAKNGEIVSAVSLPSCNLNYIDKCSNNEIFNRFGSGIYEMGSVFKVILASLAVSNNIDINKQYKRELYKIDKWDIHDIDNKESLGGYMTLNEIIAKSSNVGTAKIITEIGYKKQKEFFHKLHLLKKHYLEISENTKPMFPKRWNDVSAITISYGHGIAVNAIQFISAVASIVTGHIVYPTLIKGENDNKQNIEIIKPEYVTITQNIMQNVVKNGASKILDIANYNIGAKGGTAMKPSLGKYDKHKLLLTYVAVLPIDNPEYIIFIGLDEPFVNESNNNFIRSTILGSVMKNIILQIAPILKISQNQNINVN